MPPERWGDGAGVPFDGRGVNEGLGFGDGLGDPDGLELGDPDGIGLGDGHAGTVACSTRRFDNVMR